MASNADLAGRLIAAQRALGDMHARSSRTEEERDAFKRWADSLGAVGLKLDAEIAAMRALFTAEDVARLRDGGPELYGGLQGSSVEAEWWAYLSSLADRIESIRSAPKQIPKPEHDLQPNANSPTEAGPSGELTHE